MGIEEIKQNLSSISKSEDQLKYVLRVLESSIKNLPQQKIKCDSKTCINYNNGNCKASSIEIVNHEYWNSDEKEYNDIEKCGSYERDSQWLSR